MSRYFSDLNSRARRVIDEIQYDPHNSDAAIQSVIDRRGLDGFQWRVWWVAASGFFTTSYSIFAVHVIGPALSYVYHGDDCLSGTELSSLIINLTTLAGTIVGAVLFGFLADRHGRKKIYGLELSIVIVATIGLTTASTGVQCSMDVYGWLGFWRTLLGIGLGAEYPLSSIIAAEWSSTKSRARMMAAVFLMQPVGQLAAYGFGLAILVGLSKSLGLSPDETEWNIAARKIDVIWRVIIGIGAFPALISLVLRRTIPETPYYLIETGRVTDAVAVAGQVYAPEVSLQPTGQDGISPCQTVSEDQREKEKKDKGSWWSNTREYIREVKGHLSQRSRWRILLAVMLTWWLLDLAYYGLGLDNPDTISAIWQSDTQSSGVDVSTTKDNDRDIKIYQRLHDNIVQNIATISSGTLPGSIIILLAIDYVPRVTWMMWTFVALAALFAVNGGTFFIAFESDKHTLTIILYVLAQVVSNLGPNTLTFILPAELFATKFRGTFDGLAPAAGKLGALTILLIIKFGVYDRGTELQRGPFAGTLLGFAPAMLLGAFVSWVWIPEVQYPRGYGSENVRDENASDDGLNHDLQEHTFRMLLKLPNRPLAQIALDPEGGQVLGVRRNLGRLVQHMRGTPRRSNSTASALESGTGVPLRIVRRTSSINEHEAQMDSGDLGTGIWASERSLP
ncbi:major facilitator superfamily domain-containing protein [Xylaria arbuscula]|nr:major facilitator superfamily domain-containing protein [Xylaria arbuscula]